MKRQVLLESIVDRHRLFAMIAMGVLLMLAGLVALTFGTTDWADEAPFGLFTAIGALLLGLMGLVRMSYRRLKSDLMVAAAEQSRLLDSAHRDSLTGVATRSHFFNRLKEMLHGKGTVAYLQIDMDNLKILNDTHGHSGGDTALVHLVKAVAEVVPGALIGRLGGDEFGIAFHGHHNKAAIKRLGDVLLATLGSPITMSGRPVKLSATIGAALWPHDATEVDDLISKADLALYNGKRNGRAAIVVFDSGMVADERHKRFIERDLRAAILMNELDLHYQPIYAADGKTLKSHEALVRWQHTVRGRIMPNEFIHIAEQSDLIDKLGDWVLRRACADLVALDTPAVGINVSVVQLRRVDFAARFAAILMAAGVKGDRIVVEVTETLPIQEGTIELNNLEALRALGVRVAIDDFGAGHASLGNIRRFSFDIIKIDRSYVANLPGSRVDALIVSAICEIARSLGNEVVAEGVETQEQLAFLQKCGCTALQGYLLGRPEPLLRFPFESRPANAA